MPVIVWESSNEFGNIWDIVKKQKNNFTKAELQRIQLAIAEYGEVYKLIQEKLNATS